ncbi:hypothetical protein QFC21_005019 [Naganishia friedmannii]|uniref:Uncharacterized protein n=1 Tax=Naganishia friedmannii TaxID=89922 RepID=A0ACC2VCN7_9TREE|nr:hypothetical protein QFC21_005019 [Naganishia friedmannii]
MSNALIRSNYRTMLTHLVRLPDMEMQLQDGSVKGVSESGSGGKDAIRANRYTAQIRREIRRLESISYYLSTRQVASSPSQNGSNFNNPVPSSADRSTREERKFALKAYERMVDATYARTGKRRWEVLEVRSPNQVSWHSLAILIRVEKKALYPTSIRVPSVPPFREQHQKQYHQPRIPASPPAIPAYLRPLEKTVNLTVQAHREKKLKEIYGSDAYKEAIAVRREWKRWSKFMKGVAVPLPGGLLQTLQGEDIPPAQGSILRLIRYVSSYADASTPPPESQDSATTSVNGHMSKIPRPIRRIHHRMATRVPVLPVLQDLESLSGTRGRGKSAALTGMKGWVPPPALEDDCRWIPGAQ